MMNRLFTFIEEWASKFDHGQAVRWLRIGLYTLVAYSILVLALPIHDLLWGTHSLIAPMKFPSLWTNRLIMFLHDPRYGQLYPVFMILPFIGFALYRWTSYTRMSALLVYLGTVILFSRSYSFLTGGNYLLHILLFYLIFIDEKTRYDGMKGVLSNLLSNFGLWACRIQVIIVYLFTGMYKLAGETWRKGEAVNIITHVDEFTLPWFEHSIADIHWLMVMANYTALLYFFAFPILVWSKKWKIYLLAFGALFHLSLGIVIGVFDFSLIMIASYAAFLDKESIEKIKVMLPSKKRSVAHQ